MKKIKNILYTLLLLIVFVLINGSAFAQIAPSYQRNFAAWLTAKYADSDWRVDNVYDISKVSSEKTLEENIKCLFYPNSNNWCGNTTNWWLIWSVFRYIWFWILVLFLCVVGIKFVVQPDKAKDHLMSLVYILYWAALFFGATWILGIWLNVSWLEGTESLVDAIQWNTNSVWFKIVAFLKALVFFIAIIMVVIHGFKAMSSADKADKAQAAIKWIINVVVALVIIKIVDYLYYIVQFNDFADKATSLIIEIAKIFGFIVWALLVLMAFYAGFLFITDGGKWENMKKATKIIVWIVLVSSVIFLLLLIMYQIFAEFA